MLAAIAAAAAAREFSGTPSPCSPRWAYSHRVSQSGARRAAIRCQASFSATIASTSTAAPARQSRHADSGPGVLAGITEHLLHQIGRTVGDFGLIGKIGGAI